jgi:hypothetical protein
LRVFVEENFLTFFNYSSTGVKAFPYSEGLNKMLGFKMQTMPDALLDFQYATYSFKGVLAVDLKTSKLYKDNPIPAPSNVRYKKAGNRLAY